MNIDFFTLSAVAVVLFVLVVVIWGWLRARKSDQETLEQFRSQLRDVSSGAVIPSTGARQLCRAVRCMYPAAQVGVDFSVADGETGPFIREWSLLVPQPDDARLQKAIKECKASTETSAYREERAFAYPSVGDQLDALYKARQGDSSALDQIDSQIAAVKQQFPRPDAC